jgi:hypothetical protein
MREGFVSKSVPDAKAWTCPICGQMVVVRGPNSRLELPDGYFENCKRREHMIGDECIAFLDLDEAKRLVAAAPP